MAGAPRSNSITWAGLKVGEGTSYHLHGPHLTGSDYDSLRLSFDVVVQAAAEDDLLALTAPLEAAFRTKNADLKVTINGEDFVDLSHSSSTGFNGRSTIRATETHRTNLSRCYECSVEVALPADESGKGYRRDGSSRVVTDESGVRTLFVEATYTAGGGNNARTNATAAGGLTAYLTELFTELGGTWDATDSGEITVDVENKVASISTSYTELIYNQASGTTDLAATPKINYQLSIVRQAARAYARAGARPLTNATATFSSPVRKDETQNLKGLVTGTILPYLEQLVAAQLNATATYVVGSEQWSVNPVKNTIEGSVEFSIAESPVIQASVRTQQDETTGEAFIPVADGTKFKRLRHKGPASRTRQVTIYTLELGQLATRHAVFVNNALAAASRDGFFLLRSQSMVETLEQTTQGKSTGHRFIEKGTTLSFEYAEVFSTAGGGGRAAGIGSTSVRGSNTPPALAAGFGSE